MLTFRATIAFFIAALVGIFFLTEGPNLLIVLGLLILLVSILAIGSAQIKLNFYTKAFCRKQTKQKVVAITFDDGPDEKTEKILDLLEKYQAKATFFVVGEKMKSSTNVLNRMLSAGHDIGNHSYSHTNNFPIKSTREIENEIVQTNQLIKDLTKKEVELFRPPFGVTNPNIAKAVGKQNMKVVGWSIRSFDTVNKPKEKILARIKKNLGKGDVVLLHDTSNHILWILEELLKHINTEGYKALTITELDKVE